MTSLLRHRDLIWALVVRDLRVRYKRSALGLVWTMLQPLLTMGVMVIVFSSFFRFDLPHYPVYCLSGILFWNFFSQSIVASMVSLRANAGILHKVPLPKEVFPIATVMSGVVNLVLALVPLGLILVVGGHPLHLSLLFLPVAILIAAAFTLGMGLLLSPLAVFFTDVIEMVAVILSLVMYLTPIFYPMSIVPDRFRFVVRFNPVRSILEVFRDPIYFGKIPPLTHLSVALGFAVTALALGAWAFRRNSDKIPYYV